MRGTWGVDGGDGDDDANETHDKLGGKTILAQQSALLLHTL